MDAAFGSGITSTDTFITAGDLHRPDDCGNHGFWLSCWKATC